MCKRRWETGLTVHAMKTHQRSRSILLLTYLSIQTQHLLSHRFPIRTKTAVVSTTRWLLGYLLPDLRPPSLMQQGRWRDQSCKQYSIAIVDNLANYVFVLGLIIIFNRSRMRLSSSHISTSPHISMRRDHTNPQSSTADFCGAIVFFVWVWFILAFSCITDQLS